MELRLLIDHPALSRGREDLLSRCPWLFSPHAVGSTSRLRSSCITASLGPYDCEKYDYDTVTGLTAPAAVRLLRRLRPWHRRAVSLEVLSIFLT
jgi:hypothetical protein